MIPINLLKNYTALTVFSTTFGLLGLILPFGVPLVWVCGLIYGLGGAWLISRILFRNESPIWRLIMGTPILFVVWSAIGGITYQLYKIDLSVLILLVIGIPLMLWLLGLKFPSGLEYRISTEVKPIKKPRPIKLISGLVLTLSSMTMIGIGFSVLNQTAADISIRSPWDVVSPTFFVIFLLASLSVLGLTLSGVIKKWATIPLAGLALLMTSVAVLTYKAGFGFDPFIHQATEKIIYATGNITPKPFYYSGQYALVVAIAKLTKISLVSVDRWLLPISFAWLMPFSAWCLRRAFNFKWSIATTSATGLLLLPLGPFISTTPQGWSNILALMAFFIVLPISKKPKTMGLLSRYIPVLIALASAITHPLTGLPLLVFITAWIILDRPNKKIASKTSRWIIMATIAVLGSIILPTAFLINSALSGTDVSWNGRILGSTSTVISEIKSAVTETNRQFLPTLDIAYLWQDIMPITIWIFGMAGLWLLFKKRRRIATAYTIGLIAVIGNWIIMKTSIHFDFLINYEQTSYADRLTDLILYILAPAAIYALAKTLIKIRNSFPAMRLTAVVLLATIVTSSLYLAYPRRDKYESSRGWSTSEADVRAVNLIAADAQDQPYVVLANQSVSVAAIQEFGFSHYYQSTDPEHPGEIYFYPVPTGDSLYKLFLKMNDQLGNKKIAEQAMSLTGVNRVYFVVNDYWWQARKITSQAKRQSDKQWTINNQSYIFKYEK